MRPTIGPRSITSLTLALLASAVVLISSPVAAVGQPMLEQRDGALTTQALSACGEGPYLQWWKDFGWPRNTKNQTYRVKNPEQTRWVYITGSGTYKNVSNPQLPSGGAYNEYDTQFRSSASTLRGASRLVRDAKTRKVWFTEDHYHSWCYVGTS